MIIPPLPFQQSNLCYGGIFVVASRNREREGVCFIHTGRLFNIGEGLNKGNQFRSVSLEMVELRKGVLGGLCGWRCLIIQI